MRSIRSLRRSRRKNHNLFLLLVLMLLGLGLGYALLTQNLTINGITKVRGNTFDIHFDNVVINSNSVALSTGDSAAAIDSEDDTLVEYTVTLNTPGDFYEFTVDAVNEGTVDGMIGEVIFKLNGTAISTTNPLPSYLDYTVTYSDDVPISNNHILAVNDTETYKVRVEFLRDIDNEDLPATDQTLNFSFGVNYIQRTSQGIAVPHPFSGSGTKYTANMYNTDGSVVIGSMVPYSLTLYDSAAEARASLTENNLGTNVPFSLKHTFVNGIVTESYVEFVVTSEMATANPGMTAGTYVLKGGDSGTAYNDNKTVLQTAFGTSHCTDNTTYYSCSVSGLNAGANSNGDVNANVGYFNCNVNDDGASDCRLYDGD